MCWVFGHESCGILATKDWTCTLCTGRQSPNHWTTRKVPEIGFYYAYAPAACPPPTPIHRTYFHLSGRALNPSELSSCLPCPLCLLWKSQVVKCIRMVLEETQPGPRFRKQQSSMRSQEADVEKYLWNRDGLWRVWVKRRLVLIHLTWEDLNLDEGCDGHRGSFTFFSPSK